MTSRSDVYRAIDGERKYQGIRWNGYHEDELDRSIDEFILYTHQYTIKAMDQTVSGDEEKALHTMRKVAALAVACLERHGTPLREGFEDV